MANNPTHEEKLKEKTKGFYQEEDMEAYKVDLVYVYVYVCVLS